MTDLGQGPIRGCNPGLNQGIKRSVPEIDKYDPWNKSTDAVYGNLKVAENELLYPNGAPIHPYVCSIP